MNKVECYRILADELQSLRAHGYDVLLGRVGSTVSRIVRIGQEDVNVETVVRFDNARPNAIRVEVTAFGPNWWTTERLQESIVIQRTN